MDARITRGFHSGDEEQFANLINTICAGHESPPLYGVRTIRAMREHLPTHCHFVALRRGEQLLGATLNLEFNGVLYGWIAGLDYDTHQEYGTYQALLWETLELAATLRLDRVEMGRGMYSAKVRLGFDAQPVMALLAASDEESADFVADGLAEMDRGCRTVERVRDAYAAQQRPLPIAWQDLIGRAFATAGVGARPGGRE